MYYLALYLIVSSFNIGSLRKRRSAVPGNDSVFKFVVGNDGQCSGVPANQYCNGRLQPGRNYK